MALRVLMLGWEFPPFITGGLGTACYGLTKALDRQHVDVTFVLPKSVPADSASHVRLVSPGAVLERLGGRLPPPVGTAPRPVVSNRAPDAASSIPADPPSSAAMTPREREQWNHIVEEFNSTRFVELPGEFPGVYDSSPAASSAPSRVAESVRMMREAGWSIERIRTLAKSGAFPELARDPVERAIESALPETAGRPKEAVGSRGADAADYSGDAPRDSTSMSSTRTTGSPIRRASRSRG
jgi:hypothetical protein